MAEHTADLLLRAHWLPTPAAAQPQPDPLLLSWLTEPGLLTGRLRASCGREFRLEVLHADPSLRREVGLCCGPRRCVYAATEAPDSTVDAHPWLLEMGTASLGETLQQQSAASDLRVTRSEFHFACFRAGTLPATVLDPAADAWGRRSRFALNGLPLTVTEVFLPALLEHEQSRLRAAG